MTVYGYVRVSTERQADEGESLGTQQRTLQGYAMQHNLNLELVFIERGVSGSIPLSERPEGSKLLAAVKPGDVIVTAKLDRCFRSALDALAVLDQLKKRSVSLHMIDLGGDVTGNGISRLVFTILSAVAEAERDRIRERITDVKRDQKARNRYLGGRVPFGYRVGDTGELIEHPTEQVAVAAIQAMKAEGKSLRTIAQTIQTQGFMISHMGVKEVLSRG